MTLDELRALADKFFEWPEGSGRQTVTTFSALLFAQHVLQLREKSLGAQNSASTPTLRDAAQQALKALEWHLDCGTWGADLDGCAAALRAALEQDEKPVAKIRTWHKEGEQNAELWDWDDGIETLPDGEHLLYASAPLRAALEQQAEPVAWMCPEDPERETAFAWKAGHCENCGKQRIPLYTALVQDQDPELSAALGWPGEISDPVLDRKTLLQQVARLVERAHGIGEEYVAESARK